MKKRYIFFLLTVSLFSIGCNDSPTSPPVPDLQLPLDLSQEWQTAPPETQNIDKNKLENALKAAENLANIQSLLIVRNGYLVSENYFNGNTANSLNHVRSVTKSVISALVGIAIREGVIQDREQPISNFMPGEASVLGGEKADIKIKHLLTMTSGFEWDESGGGEYSAWAGSGDHINYVLDKDLSAPPGGIFNYNSGAVHLLSVILTEASGMSTQEFLDEHLFAPLGVSNNDWEQDSRSYFNGGAGLQLRPRDMAKFGFLFMQNGTSGEKSIVPKAWVDESQSNLVNGTATFGSIQNLSYGLLWWVGNAAGHDVYFAWGYGGQFIFNVPALNTTIVATSLFRLAQADASAQERALLSLIGTQILPAFE